jgi:hypothetical protein
MSNKLILRDLKAGSRFICFPVDGDNHGHGGYKGGHYVYQKIDFAPKCKIEKHVATVRLIDGCFHEEPECMEVIEVI